MLAIRRQHRDLIHAVAPDQVDIRLNAVPATGPENLPVPYALSNGKRALLVIGNPTDRNVDVVLGITIERLALPADTKVVQVVDLWPTEQAPRRVAVDALSQYRCTVPGDGNPGGGLRVLRFELMP